MLHPTTKEWCDQTRPYMTNLKTLQLLKKTTKELHNPQRKYACKRIQARLAHDQILYLEDCYLCGYHMNQHEKSVETRIFSATGISPFVFP